MSSIAAPGLRVVSSASVPASQRDEPGNPGSGRRHGPDLRVVPEQSDFGHRVVGITTVLGVAALIVMLGLAMFHNMLAKGQYELTQLDEEVAIERNSLLDRRFQLESRSAPSEVETLGRGALGLEAPSEPIDIAVSAEVMRLVSSAEQSALDDHSGGWITLKPLLTDP
jgi:hypothetical protein